MDHVLSGLDFIYADIGNVLVASSSEEHKEHIGILFRCPDEYGIVIKTNKWVFAARELTFLGHRVTVQEIRNYPVPNSLNQLRRFLGMMNFYRHILLNATGSPLPLTNLLKGSDKLSSKKPLSFSEGAVQAFNVAHRTLANATTQVH